MIFSDFEQFFDCCHVFYDFLFFCLFFVYFCGNFRQSWYPPTKGDARGERLSKRVLNDPSEIAERSRDHSRDTLAISAAIPEQRII